jgi:hypothetical protein
MSVTSSPARIAELLAKVHDLFVSHGIWHALAYGSLLGAVRDGDVVPWDYDFDLFVRPADVRQIVELNREPNPHGLTFKTIFQDPANLAVNPGRVTAFWTSSLVVREHGCAVGDLYAFTVFRDGVARRFDLRSGTYYYPHSSFPNFFLEDLDEATIRGVRYPIPRHAEKWLEGNYGADWRVPYRAERQGGAARPGATIYGDRYAPRLAHELAWCVERGWDRSVYAEAPAWPQAINAGGPIGLTPGDDDCDRVLWGNLDDTARLF